MFLNSLLKQKYFFAMFFIWRLKFCLYITDDFIGIF